MPAAVTVKLVWRSIVSGVKHRGCSLAEEERVFLQELLRSFSFLELSSLKLIIYVLSNIYLKGIYLCF